MKIIDEIKLTQMIKQLDNHAALDLTDKELNKEAWQILIENLQRTNAIKLLSLRGNKINNREAEQLGKALESNRTLTFLDLSDNLIDQNGLVTLCRALNNNDTLVSINLSHNQINGTGASNLINSLSIRKTLVKLDLSHNLISEDEIKKLDEILYKHTTIILNLSHQNIDISGDNNSLVTAPTFLSADLKESPPKSLSVFFKFSSCDTDLPSNAEPPKADTAQQGPSAKHPTSEVKRI